MTVSSYSTEELTIIATPHDHKTAWITIVGDSGRIDLFFDPKQPKKLLDLKAAVDKLIEAYSQPQEVDPLFVPSQATREAIDDITTGNDDDIPF
jgi:hypothetical protein